MAVLDLLTIEETRLAIGARGDNQTDWLAELNSGISERIDQICGPVVARGFTEMYEGGRSTLALRQTPVSSITSITEYRVATPVVLTAETAGTAPVAGYTADLTAGIVTRRTNGQVTRFAPGPHVTVVYQAGRCPDTQSVPSRFKTCASIAIANLWEQTKGKGDPQFPAADGIFRNYMLPYSAQDFIKNDRRYAIA